MRKLTSVAVTAIIFVASTINALAHAKMIGSNPKDGATVGTGLSELQFDFSKPMQLAVVKVTNAKDHHSVALKGELAKEFTKASKILVEPLAPGSYEVTWSAIADDGHVMNGAFKFYVSEAKDAPPKP